MSVGTTQSTSRLIGAINTHTGRVHPDRVIVPQPKPFDAPPGIQPFHRYLEALNRRIDQEGNDPCRCQIMRGADQYIHIPDQSSGSTARLLPTLGEVLPVAPRVVPSVIERAIRPVEIAATGRVLDVYL